MQKRICEHSLRWVLNMRQALRNKPELIIKNNHDLLEKEITKDGHTCSTFYWTLNQVNQIEKIGFDQWLNNNQINYEIYFNKIVS